MDRAAPNRRRGPADRRRHPTPLLSRYTLFGRRRANRRRSDPRENYYVDLYGSRLFAALLLLVALSLLDAVFTYLHVVRGGAWELNPVMAVLLAKGPQVFFPYKFALTAASIFILCLHKNFRLVRPVITLLVFVYALLLVYHVGILYAF